MNPTAPLEPEELPAALSAADPAERLAAVQRLEQSALPPAGLAEVVRCLERLAVHDDSPAVRQAALEALAGAPLAAAQRGLSHAQTGGRQFMLEEIAAWEKDGLLSPAQAGILRGRYALGGTPRPAAPPAAASPAERPPAPALSQMLLSETSVKIALYLGAFFVVAAAFILAALIEVARLPILGAFTLIFFGAALGLRRRLPMASFVLFAVAGLLAPIAAGVLAVQIELPAEGVADDLYWSAVALLSGLVWAAGIGLYRSRLFSLFSFAGFALSGFILAAGLFEPFHAALLAAGLATLAGLPAARYLGRRYDHRLFWPLFLFIQAVQGLILAASFFDLLAADSGVAGLLAAVTWALAAVFYVFSDRLALRFGAWLPFAVPAVGASAAALPILLIWTRLEPQVETAAAWLWGALLLAAAEWLREQPPAWQPVAPGETLPAAVDVGGEAKISAASAAVPAAAPWLYPPLLLLASGGLFTGTGSAAAQAGDIWRQIVYLLAAGGLYLFLALRRPRWAWWSAALVMFVMANFAVHSLPEIIALDLFPGFVPLLPAAALLALDLGLRRGGAGPGWTRPALVLGVGLSGLFTLVAGVSGFDEPAGAALAFVIFGSVLLVYAGLTPRSPDRLAAGGRPLAGWAGLAALALALIFGLIDRRPADYLSPLIGLAVVYDLIGLALAILGSRLRRSAQAGAGAPPAGAPGGGEQAPALSAGSGPFGQAARVSWAAIFQSSGLILGFVVALAAPLQPRPLVVAAAALLASLYVVEAYRRDNVWLGFPAAALFFIAYGVALWELDVREPQFYSIFAALLGIGMYHLLARRRHTLPALLTGLLAQLILLSTTYFQMVGGEDFQFFFILFFQSLALLAYGLAARSRSFVVAPLVALVVSVVTVALTVLSGLPTALIIGCTGILLLLLGIAALALRERLARAADHWAGRLDMP